MKNLILSLTLAAAMFVGSCGPKGPRELPVLDVTKSYPAKNLLLQDIADVEYIPLETREGFLIDYFRVRYMDDEIMVTSNNNGDIMIFDRRTGKGLRSFNRHGRGPGEYPFPSVRNIAVDSEAGEMFVTLSTSHSDSAYSIYVYDLYGKSLRTIEFGGYTFPQFFHNYDSEHLFFLNRDTSQPELFNLASKTDTVVTRLPVKLTGDRSTMTVTKTEGSGYMRYSRGDAIAKTADGYMISEPGLDTMWRWNKTSGVLTPVMAQTPSFHSMEYPIGMFFWAENDDYIFLDTYERKYDFEKNEGFKNVRLIYDKHSGEFFEGDILNADFADERPTPHLSPSEGVPAGMFVMAFQPYELLDLHEEGKLRGPLAELVSTLKEDDNPVIMVVTVK